MTLFQISCQKDAQAQTTTYTLPPATTTLGGVIVGTGLSVTPTGVLSVTASGSTQLNLLVYYKIVGTTIKIWTAKFDGPTQTKINLTVPANTEFSDDVPPQLSPDGTKFFFTLQSTVVGQSGTDLNFNLLCRLKLYPEWVRLFGIVSTLIYLLAQAGIFATLLPGFQVWEMACYIDSTLLLKGLLIIGIKSFRLN